MEQGCIFEENLQEMKQGCIFEEDTKLNLQEMKQGCIFEEDTELNLQEMKQACLFEEDTELTVLKTSLFYSGDGFSVYDSKGNIVFRVDSYGSDVRDRDELFLMDASGKCAVTVRRKRPSLHQRWEGYLGERIEGKKPIFSVRRSSILGRTNVIVEVFGDPAQDYQIEGSFCQRSCRFLNSARDMVAEIKRKMDGPAHVVFGKDVFALWVKPGVDATFVMALVLVLDHINGAEDWYDGDDEEEAATEPHTKFF